MKEELVLFFYFFSFIFKLNLKLLLDFDEGGQKNETCLVSNEWKIYQLKIDILLLNPQRLHFNFLNNYIRYFSFIYFPHYKLFYPFLCNYLFVFNGYRRFPLELGVPNRTKWHLISHFFKKKKLGVIIIISGMWHHNLFYAVTINYENRTKGNQYSGLLNY